MTPPPLTPQVTTVKGLDDWATRDFSKNAAAAVKYAEMRDRANAKLKGLWAQYKTRTSTWAAGN